jgi:hypothetical protein
MEICPICKGQLLCCDCDKSKIIDNIREPYFDSVFCCERCGKKMPNLHQLPDNEWRFICGITYPKECVLCIECMDWIKTKREKIKDVESN